ncbi:FAD:protein FMN transferase [Kribbella monticola]|uniref:FAD:protein FMN transferase n=1 Tax=Kribbella monticola TaxID=2185285 RepID=UPI001E2F7BED|nr:FAD:protein FMN transferase [Kribbella monticola]
MNTPMARYVEQVMGMPISLALRGKHTRDARARSTWEAVVDELREVDRVFSTYRADSFISRLGRDELSLPDCPPEVSEVLEIANQAVEISDGAFSVYLPDPAGGLVFDPSGVVKGWAVERAARRYLDGLEDTDYCLSAGGDMVARTLDPTTEPWCIGIEDPLDPNRLVATVPVRTGAVATSGTSHRGTHIIDPRTGRPAYGIASVTVVGDSLTWVDIEATAAFAQGAQALSWLRTRPRRTGLIVWADGQTTLFDTSHPVGQGAG